jgi:hypothetical protein
VSHSALSPQQFFHGSEQDLAPGTVLTGGHPMSRRTTSLPRDMAEEHNKRVWMHTEMKHAAHYGRVYEVEPEDPKEEPGEGPKRWTASRAKVVKNLGWR